MRTTLPLLLSLLVLVMITGCRKDEQVQTNSSGQKADVPVQWIDLSLKLTKETGGFSPPVAARAWGYIGVALYEAIAPSSSKATSLQGQITGFNHGTVPRITSGAEYNWDIVANAVLSHSFRKYYRAANAENWALINKLDSELHNFYAARTLPDVASRSREFGLQVADAVYAFSVTDGQDECFMSNFPSSYTLPAGPGYWVPTPPPFLPALQPYWGDVRPFLGINVTTTQPPGPPPFSEDPGSQFYLEALEVFTISKNPTPEQKVIAEFWSDDPGNTATPPGHSVSILNQIIKSESPSLIEAAAMYASMGMAIHDAFVSCWRTKYITNVIRPVSYIHDLYDSSYKPVLITPPFPEYTSGHSVNSGASAAILAHFFGDNYTFSDRTHVNRTDIDGSPRHFTSFSQYANEAAISRLYGGIHYRAAIDHGVEQGQKVGKNIAQLKLVSN